jgi:hypothetical protein
MYLVCHPPSCACARVFNHPFVDMICCMLYIGRGVGCDFIVQHPSLSRRHAILQYRDNGIVSLVAIVISLM